MNKNGKTTQLLLIFLFFAFLGVIYSWPLALHLFDAIPYSYDQNPTYKTAFMFQGDHLQALYHFMLLKDAALGYIDWFTNPYEFATVSQPPIMSTYFLPLSIICLPFLFISETLAYNIFIILAMGAGGLAMYLWAKELTGSSMAGFFAGIVFNVAPLRLVELFGGHPAGHAIFLFPLSLYFFDRAVKEKSLLCSGLGGASALVLALQYNYFSYYLLMFLLVYIPWRLIPPIRASFKEGRGADEIKRLALVGVPFAVGIFATLGWMLYFKKKVVSTATFEGGRTMGEVALYSPKLSAIWSPGLDWSVYLGIPLCIALVWVLASPFLSNVRYKRDTLFFGIVFAVTYILAFGVTLNGAIPLYSLFYEYFPYFNMSRSPVKIMVITISTLSILVAFFVAWSETIIKWKTGMRLLVVGLLLLTVVDYHPRRDIGLSVLDRNNKIYELMASEADGKKSLNIPLWPGESSWSSIYQYYAVKNRVAMINGYSPIVSKSYIDQVFWPLFTVNSGDLDESQVKLLKKMGVGYIIFHEEAYPPKVSAFPQSMALKRLHMSPFLELAGEEAPLTLFRLTDNSPKELKTSEVTSPMGLLFQSESLVRINGKPEEDADAGNGVALVYESAGGEKIINAGPYMTFPTGTYRVTFRVKVSDNSSSEPLVRLDVAGDQGRVVLAEKIIRGSDFTASDEYQDFSLEYTLYEGIAWQVEFRPYLLGRGKIYIDSVYVIFADRADPAWQYEAEQMYYTGKIEKDDDANGGLAVVSTPGRDPADVMMRGPNRVYEAGEYTARFRLKTQKINGTGIVAKISAYSVNTGKLLHSRDVMANDFKESWKYQSFTLPFSLRKKDVVEFRVYFSGTAKVATDSVTVEARSQQVQLAFRHN